jgi:hypothetical protein
MTPAEEYVRRQAHLLLQVAQEREAAERASRCGTAADLEGFEPRLAELVQERIG